MELSLLLKQTRRKADKSVVLRLLAHVTSSIFFSRILRSKALVYNAYFIQNRRSTEIIRH